MNELHDYPPHWDEIDITESSEFEGLLTKNVEALFTSKGVNDDFMVALNEHESDEGNYLEQLVEFIKKTDYERLERDKYYARFIADELLRLREELSDLAVDHVRESTKQECNELKREAQINKQSKVSGF